VALETVKAAGEAALVSCLGRRSSARRPRYTRRHLMANQAGSRLGPYELVSPIGAGGMGEVWRGRDTRLDRSVAVKILPASFAQDEQFRARFAREAKTISSLNHPHICTLFDVGQEGDNHFLVMELLEGESLADRLLKGPLPLDQVVRFGAQVADALEGAHKQGIVHRDLKPGNVMLTKTGAKLLDFGLARTGAGVAGRSGSTELPTEARPLTTAGTVLGTFQYMAPEQLEGSEADARTDIFALGALLYEMATGRRAFDGKSKTSLIAAILSTQPPAISSVQPVMPPALDHVVRKCLEKDPEDRWQSAHDVASELRWIAEAGSQAGVPATVTIRRRSRERLAWTLVALLVAATGALGILSLRRGGARAEAFRATLNPPPDTSLIPFDELGLSLSPDGRQLAFVAIAGDGSKKIWIRDLSEMSARPVPETDGAWYPFWSPDGRSLAFFADGKLKKIDLRGGSPQVIADAPSGRGGSWGPNDVILFSPNINSGIHWVAATGGTPTPVTRFDAEKDTSHRWPQFLPDGKHFLFLLRARISGKPEVGRLALGSLDSPEATVLIEDATNAAYVEPGYIVYGRSNNLYAWRFDVARRRLVGQPSPVVKEKVSFFEPKNQSVFTASDSGVIVYLPEAVPRTTLQWADAGGRNLGSLGPPGFYTGPRIAPDGTKVAYALADSSQGLADLWVRDLQYDRTLRVTQKSGIFFTPVWSRDSSRLMFACQLKGVPDLCVRSLKGGGEAQVVYESGHWKTPGSWTPDGTLLFSEQDPQTNEDLKSVSLDGKAEPRVLLQTPFDESFPQASPDGKWYAYLSNESGRSEVCIRSTSGSYEQWQVSTEGGSQARWRGDGRELYYLAPDGYVMAVAIETQPVFRPGPPRRLFQLPEKPLRDTPVFEDVTPDGKRFLLNVPVTAPSSVGFHLIVNWPSLLEASKS
jgi:serine/threonine protein kinase/Tol biopolymer transport system component